jgi:hypothetical protein
MQVDLGSSRLVDRVTLNWASDYATHYVISTSTDGTSFTQADDVSITAAGLRTSAFNARRARYVRVTGLARSSPAGGISLWALRVFGPADIRPSNTVRPKVSGTPKVGKRLVCSAGTWAGSPPLSFSYRWRRNGSRIAGASSRTYTPRWADAGQLVSCAVRATNAAGSASATSPAVRVPLECRVPAVKGKRFAAARTSIVAAHCRLGSVTKRRSSGVAGVVLSQNPKARTRLPLGSRVALVVSKQ